MKLLYVTVFAVLIANAGQAQVKIYLRFIDYSNKTLYGLNTAFVANPDDLPKKNNHEDEVQISTFSDNDEQTLNIGSQSTGAGAGKVTFNPFNITKKTDAQSPSFFVSMASGTPFQWVEVSFYKSAAGGDLLVYKIRMSLVGIKSISRASASCTGDCPDIIENYAMQYGAKYISYFPQNSNGSSAKGIGGGWNRVKNVKWTGADAIK